MIEPVRRFAAEIDYNGRKLPIEILQGETLSNDWIDFGVKSGDDTFVQVFGKNPIPVVVKPKQPFKPDYDFFQNTPDQLAIVKEIWAAIQRIYF